VAGVFLRKNVKLLTADETSAFQRAVQALKDNGKYDRYAKVHETAMNDGSAHRGPAFLPWHCKFLMDFENDLRAVTPGLSVPYWDWSSDSADPEHAAVWGVVGGRGDPNDGYKVKDGPFTADKGWSITREFFGRQQFPTPQDVAEVLDLSAYDTAPWNEDSEDSFRNTLEGWAKGVDDPQLHNLIHVWIGGSMGPPTSPDDPIFWLHHCNTDRLHWQWGRQMRQYAPSSGARLGQNFHDPMSPWGAGTTPQSVLYSRQYSYDGINIPNLNGETMGDLPAIVRGLGITFVKSGDTADDDVVVDQTPAPGTWLAVGSECHVTGRAQGNDNGDGSGDGPDEGDDPA